MRTTVIAALLFLPTAAIAANCMPTPRMSETRSNEIKKSMLPAGHSMAEYELDHIMPLCLGGSNNRSNLQMQVWVQAHLKDRVEWALCDEVRAGEMTCVDAHKAMGKWKTRPTFLPNLETD